MKRIYTILMVLVAAFNLHSQDNVAPLASITASPGCNTGPCETLNNGNYGTCGTQQMWISGGQQAGQWIEFRWDDPYFFAGMQIFHAQNNTRFLCGFQLQRWENNNWVTHMNITNLPMQCENMIDFDDPFMSDRIRIFNFTHCGSQLSNANFREIEIYAFSADAEAESVSLVSNLGSSVCLMGSYPVNVRIRNNGPGLLGPLEVRVQMEGGNSFVETIDASEIDENTARTFQLNTLISPTRLGDNLRLSAVILTPDTDDSNNETVRNINVIGTPTGSEIRPDGDFPGFPSQGTFFEKDVITYNKQFSYDITPPTKYSNAQHGNAWLSEFSITRNGSPLPGSRYTYRAPSASGNARVDLNLIEDDVEGEILIRFRVLDLAGNGCDTFATRYIYVAPMPKPIFDGLQVCLGAGLQFQNFSTINSGGMTYEWDFGDGNPTSTLFEPNYVYTQIGTYDVKLIARSLIGFVDSITQTISVNPTPVADFDFRNQCGSQPVLFNNRTSIAGGRLNFNWTFGDGQSSQEENPTITYAQAGPYTVTLEVESDNGCVAQLSKSAFSYPQPHADFVLPQTACAGSELNLQNQTQISFSNWGSEWTFPSGTRTFTTNPRLLLKEAGNADVKLRVTTQYGCVDSIAKSVEVVPGPFIQITHSDACVGAPVTFQSNVMVPENMPVDYIWNIDGVIYGEPQPSVLFNQVGSQNVHVTISYANGCVSSASKVIPTGYRPHADFEIGGPVCSGTQVNLENRTTSEFGTPQYFWNMGDGTSYSQFAPRHAYQLTESESVQVTLIAKSQNGACPDTVSKAIQVGITPSCEFSIEEVYLPGHRAFQFVPESHNASQYTWSFGNGSRSHEVNPTFQYQRDGLFDVNLKAKSEEGCACDLTQELRVLNLSNDETQYFAGAISLYPNPTQGSFSIQNTHQLNIQKVEVLDVVGNLIGVYDISSSLSSIPMNLPSLSNGVYLVKVFMEQNLVSSQRLIVAQ